MDSRDIIIDTRAKKIAARRKSWREDRFAMWSFLAGAGFAELIRALVAGWAS